MSTVIQDGTGTKFKAKVNDQNRLTTLSVIETRVSDISEREGKAFIIASGFIDFTTTGSFQAHTYIKNTSNDDMFIEAIRLCSTGGSGTMLMNGFQTKVIKNPTTGSIVSEAVVAPGLNPSKIGSSQTFEGIAYVAAGSDKTFTDGSFMSNFTTHSPGHTIQIYNGALILTKGSSIGLEVNPTVTGSICSEIQCWFEAPKG